MATHSQSRWVLCIPAMAAILSGPMLAAQQPVSTPATKEQMESSPAAAPPFRVSTGLTVEDVTVTDAKGAPVLGLVQSDFVLKEDGKPQTIRNFEEYGAEKPQVQGELPKLPSDVYTNAQPSAPTTDAVNVLLLDDVSTGLSGAAMAPDNLANAKEQSTKYLKTMPAGTQVVILQLGSVLRVVQGMTSDKAVLLAAMHSVSYKPVTGMTAGSSGLTCAAANAQSELIVNALEQAAAFLSGIKGRKNLIWFTPGTPWLTDYPTFSATHPTPGKTSCLRDYSAQLHRDYGLLNAAEVALYPVDLRNSSSDSTFGSRAEMNSSQVQLGQMSTNMAMTNMTNPSQGVVHAAVGGSASSERDSLQQMADATGGVPYFNRNDIDAAVREAVRTGGHYYSLSYMPPLAEYDNQYHTIEVTVDRPGVKLRYRKGYTAVDLKKGAEAAQDELPGAMGHGVADSTEIIFDVRMTPSATAETAQERPVIGSVNPVLKGKSLFRYDLLCTLSPDQITLAENADGTRRVSVKFLLVAYDGEGTMLNVAGVRTNLILKPDKVAQFLQGPLRVPLQFDLPQGNIFVRVGVQDAASEKMGTLEIPQTVESR
jgi:VWFA-related protein